jgi:phenylacetate-CoA ligase
MEIIGDFKELGGEYQMELTRDEHFLDHLLLTVERARETGGAEDAELVKALERRLHKTLLTRVDVRLTGYASLPRTFGKSKRVVDKR